MSKTTVIPKDALRIRFKKTIGDKEYLFVENGAHCERVENTLGNSVTDYVYAKLGDNGYIVEIFDKKPIEVKEHIENKTTKKNKKKKQWDEKEA